MHRHFLMSVGKYPLPHSPLSPPTTRLLQFVGGEREARGGSESRPPMPKNDSKSYYTVHFQFSSPSTVPPFLSFSSPSLPRRGFLESSYGEYGVRCKVPSCKVPRPKKKSILAYLENLNPGKVSGSKDLSFPRTL